MRVLKPKYSSPSHKQRPPKKKTNRIPWLQIKSTPIIIPRAFSFGYFEFGHSLLLCFCLLSVTNHQFILFFFLFLFLSPSPRFSCTCISRSLSLSLPHRTVLHLYSLRAFHCVRLYLLYFAAHLLVFSFFFFTISFHKFKSRVQQLVLK